MANKNVQSTINLTDDIIKKLKTQPDCSVSGALREKLKGEHEDKLKTLIPDITAGSTVGVQALLTDFIGKIMLEVSKEIKEKLTIFLTNTFESIEEELCKWQAKECAKTNCDALEKLKLTLNTELEKLLKDCQVVRTS